MIKNKKRMIGTISAYLGFGMVAMVVLFNNTSILGRNHAIYNLTGDVISSGEIDIKGFNSVEVLDEPEDDSLNDAESTSDEPEKMFFKFMVTTRVHNLRIREAGSLTAKVIGKMPKGVTGYILEVGDEWSLVKYDDIIGYSNNKYLDIVQIAKEDLPEDFPEEYK